MRKVIITILFFFITSVAHSEEKTPKIINDLLSKIQKISASDRILNKKREQFFDNEFQQQRSLLNKSQLRLQKAKIEQIRLKKVFDKNDIKLADMEVLIQQRAGQLGEVFGVAKENAAELRSLLNDALTSADNLGRTVDLAFSESKRIPTLKQLESLWYQLQLEMFASGNISRFEFPVVLANGNTLLQSVIRFGQFAAVTEQGQYLHWNGNQQTLTVLPTQPKGGVAQLSDYLNGRSNEIKIDPSRGQLFLLLDREPKLMERIHQGGGVGYLILALGVIGLLVAVVQIVWMVRSELKIRQQLRVPDKPNSSNILGRVLLAVSDHTLNQEQRELKLDEATLQELPLIERCQSLIKLLAAVTPLLGLLGTVIGMIATFQSITLFGSSDPKLMAGGISQALMTTVLGLVVSIPLLFCHSYLSARSRRLIQVLQQKSLALLSDTSQLQSKQVI
ncbi:MAG: MotA/TolQ/ExbB proton channel family protein [Gammaproteobacteria bacterium]|nr:MotA/TolQ/ExbB proton channel family protein [Gammaproteobacteria bacterium]